MTTKAADENSEEQVVEVKGLLPAEDSSARAASNKLARYDPLKRYLLEISRFQDLSREEEHELAIRLKATGDPEAAYRLITSNLRLVVKIAMIYHKIYQNLLDLIQEGNVGLLQAVQRFDPDRGTRLRTYAAWWIKAYILRFLLDNKRLVRIGTTNTRRKILRNLNREKGKLAAQGITPTPQLLAMNLGVDEQELVEVERGMAGGDISLETPIGGEESDLRFGDTLSLMEESVEEKIAQGEFRLMLEEKLASFTESLPERDKVILEQRLIADEPRTLQEIADLYGITREAIRVAEKKLIGRLKQHLVESFKDVREIEIRL